MMTLDRIMWALLVLAGLWLVPDEVQADIPDEGPGVNKLLDSLVVAPENRCSPYNRKDDYHYPSSVEWDIARVHFGTRAGRRGWLDRPIASPFTAHVFVRSLRDTDIEHVVAAAEAHDSGLCARDRETRIKFARDLLNLTLALPSVNRYEKIDKDAAEWLPEINRCWFAETIVRVKSKYSLTVDAAEAAALRRVLGDCP